MFPIAIGDGFGIGIRGVGLGLGLGCRKWVYGYRTDLAKVWERYGVELGRDMDMGWDWDDHRMG